MKTKYFQGMLMLGLAAVRLSADQPSLVVLDPGGITGFELYGMGGLWWDTSGDCSGEFQDDGAIRARIADINSGPNINSGTKKLAFSCEILTTSSDNAARDALYVYFIRDEQIYRKSLAASESSTGTAVPGATLGNGQDGTYLELANGRLWFARIFAAGVYIYSLKTDQSEGPEVAAFIQGAQAHVRKMKWFTFLDFLDGNKRVEALAILLENGSLYIDRIGQAGSATRLATRITDFAIHTRHDIGFENTYIFAAEGTLPPNLQPDLPPGRLLRMNAITGDSHVIYTACPENQLVGVATDSDVSAPLFGDFPRRNIYIVEASVGCGEAGCAFNEFVIKRRTYSPGFGEDCNDPDWDPIVLNQLDLFNLRSDDLWLYFLRGNTIQRIATDAPSLERDIKAIGLEVVQFMQTENNDQFLIANKAGTYLRGYATALKNNTGQTPLFPSATLSVFLDGHEISGSPFAPINNAFVDTIDFLFILRDNIDRSFLFSLPKLAAGSLTMTMDITRSILETGGEAYANNTISLPQPVSVRPSLTPCLVMVPMPTPFGRYETWFASFPNIIRRAESLLPIEGFDIRNWGPLTEDHDIISDELFFPAGTFFGIDSGDPQDDDALDAVDCVRENSEWPGGCRLAHWGGMIHPSVGGFGGLGKRPGLSFIASMSGDEIDSPRAPGGGVTIAHELGHNYGRKHVGCACGSTFPQGTDDNYPGVPCWILQPGLGLDLWGFDPLTQQPVHPLRTGDLMSYECTRWPSLYTWNSIYAVLTALVGAAGVQAAGPSPQAGVFPTLPVLFISGVVYSNQQTAKFGPFIQLPAEQFNSQNVLDSFQASARELGATNTIFAFRLLDAQGTLLREVALPLDATGDGANGRYSFTHFIPFEPQTRIIQLAHGNVVFGERIVSPNAPTLQPGIPVVDDQTQTLELSWSASDADGDAVVFTIYYSADDGATWRCYSINYRSLGIRLSTASWPASSTGRLRVVATDGVNTAYAMTDRFVIPNHAPEPMIGGVTEGERIPYGETHDIFGLALDAEDGRLGVRLSWSLTGPTPLTGTNDTLPLLGISPGAYSASLTATDSAGQQATAVRNFEVLPLLIPEGPAPILDGLCNDPAYTNSAFVRIPLGGGQIVPVRIVHSGGSLFVAFSDLQFGRAGLNRTAGLRVDVNGDRTALGQPGDIGFFVDEDGVPFEEIGTGSGMKVTLLPQLGFAAVVQHGSSGWSAEFQIVDSLLGGRDHMMGIMLDHDSPDWPALANDDQPVTWAPAYLGGTAPPPTNRPPVANAGGTILVNVSGPRSVVLDGSGSYDPDGKAIGYDWMQVAGPSVTLSNANCANPSFIVQRPASVTTLRFRLTVHDGTFGSSPSTVEVTLVPVERFLTSMRALAQFDDGIFWGRFRGKPGQRCFVQASTNLINWVTIRTNSMDSFGLLDFIESDIPKYPMRFYRAVDP